jgi:SAM-dependent methyltransferase
MRHSSGGDAGEVFDAFVDTYEEACGRGLALSGESREYFARQRVALTRRFCLNRPVRRVLDFGCGLGHSTPVLGEAFPDSEILGVDTSCQAIAFARRRYGSERVQFVTDLDALPLDAVDVAYTNGTFHHISERERPEIVGAIASRLAPGGLLVLWENNPWNPGTRLVMRRIPFGRDAETLSCRVGAALLAGAGLLLRRCSSHFYFPSWLRWLRPAESCLERLPFGAQYCLVAEKPRFRQTAP